MAFPSSMTLVSVHGEFDAPPDGGATGWVRFIWDYPLVGASDNSIIPPGSELATLDADGEFTVQLPATDDPQWSPTGWAYRVEFSINGAVFSGTMQLAHGTASVELADVIQISGTATAGVSYVLTAQRSVAGGVAGLDADGDVINAAGEKVGEAAGGGISETIVNAKGDLIVATAADTVARFAVGTNGQVLRAASGETSGLQWGTLGDAALLNVGTTTGTVAAGDDSRLTNARTPTAHASSHADGGSDEISIDGSQVTAGTVPIARIPTGTSGSTVALGDAPAAAVTTHVAASDPHTQYARVYYSTGSGYSVVTTGDIYVGPDDPGAVGDGSVWIDTDA